MRTFYYINHLTGAKEPDYDEIVRYLLDNYVLFVGQREVTEERNPVLALYVLINDVFVPAADSLDISRRELPELLELYLKHGDYGTIIWAAEKNRQQPRKRIKEEMQREGLWTPELEQLAPNRYP